VAASSRKGIHMTGNFEHTKCTGPNAASSRTEASASLVKAEDIITPEELAARLKVPRLLGLRKDPRALPESDSIPAARALRAIQLGGRGNMAERSRAPKTHIANRC
jgi:hypothetical protein